MLGKGRVCQYDLIPERSLPTPRAKPSLIQSTTPWYPGMEHGRVTGWPATTTRSWGSWANLAPTPEKDKKQGDKLDHQKPSDSLVRQRALKHLHILPQKSH